MSQAAPRFKAIRFNANDFLFKEGTPNEDVFFLITGKVAFVLPEYKDLVYVTFEPGEYVGDIDFAANKDKGIRLFSAKAQESTEAYFLNVADLHSLELYFQETMLEFFDQAEIRYKQAKKMKGKAEKHIVRQSEAIIHHQVVQAIQRAKANGPEAETEEKQMEGFNARQGLGGQLARAKRKLTDSFESAKSFQTETEESKSKSTSTFKSDTSFEDESEENDGQESSFA